MVMGGLVVPWARDWGRQGSQGNAGQAVGKTGQPQPWTSGIYVGMKIGWGWDEPGEVETESYNFPGTRADSSWDWSGVLGRGQDGGVPGTGWDFRAPECTQGLNRRSKIK